MTVRLQWTLESPLVHLDYAGKRVTIQYLDVQPLGYVLQHYGTKVGTRTYIYIYTISISIHLLIHINSNLV